MATFTNVLTYRRSINTRMNNMRKRATNNAAKASIYMQGRLKSTAPIKSGALAGSVRRRKSGKGYSVLAGYKKGTFNVGRFVNKDFVANYGFKKFNYYFAPGQAVRYGDFAISPSGKTIRWTARADPWFDSAKEKTIRRYRAGYKNVRMALRS